MPRPSRISRATTAALFASSLLFAGCHKDRSAPGEPDKPPRPARLSPRPSGSGALAGIPKDLRKLFVDGGLEHDAGGTKLAEKEIARIREHDLSLKPRRVPEQRIAFGRAGLAQLTGDALIVRETKKWKKRARVPVTGGRAVIVLADGSFLVLSATGSYRLARGQDTPEIHPRVTMFPGSVGFPDRRDKNHFWVLHAFDETLYQYQLESAIGSMMGMGDFVELKGFDHQVFAALKDGSFLYSTGDGFRRFYPKGKSSEVKPLPGKGKVWRLLTTKRIDRVWVARGDGDLELSQVGSALRSVKKIDVPPMLFDIASNDKYLAVLRVEQPDGGRRSWKLAVYDADGKPKLEATLPQGASPPPGEDWVKAVTENRSVVLAPHAPLVAVGGPSELTVWNIKTGKTVLSP